MALHRAGLLLIGLGLMVGACASSNKPAASAAAGNPQNKGVNDFGPATKSGIISDYARLKPSPEFPGTLVWTSGKLGNYDKFIVDPVTIVPSESARGIPISAAEKQRLAAEFRYDLVDVLQATHKVVVTPMPRTARIKAGVTQVARSTGTEMQWFRWEGGAAAEMEITDAMTGEPLASAIDSDVVKAREPSPVKDPYGDTKLVFRHWAARLGKWLITAR